jgi:hypothetical protein
MRIQPPASTKPGAQQGVHETGSTPPAGCWQRYRCEPGSAARLGHRELRQRQVDQVDQVDQVAGGAGRGVAPVAGSRPAARPGLGRGPGRPAAAPTRTNACRCLPPPAWHRCGPTPRSRPRPSPAAQGRGGRWPPRHGRRHGPGRRAAGQAVSSLGQALHDPPGGRG